MYDVLVRAAIAMKKHHDQKQGRKERVYWAYTSTSPFIIEGSQDRNSLRAGTWRQELVQRPRRGAAYWLAPHDLLSLLSYRTQDHQSRHNIIHSGLGPPHQSLIKKMLYRLAYSWILQRRFLK